MLRSTAMVLLRGWNATASMTAAGIPSKALLSPNPGLLTSRRFLEFFRNYSALPKYGGKSSLLQTARGYPRGVRKRKPEIDSHFDDLPPTILMKRYAKVPVIDKVDDVVKRMLSLEMASQKEKLKIKKEQLAEKVRRSPNDCCSLEVQIAYLTARIRTLQEHLQRHPKDKENRRKMMMVIDRRNLLLKALRNREYDVFVNTCKQLNIEYTFPPLYCRRATRRWLVKKDLCRRVFEEVKKKKALERLKQRAEHTRAAKDQAVQNEGTPV